MIELKDGIRQTMERAAAERGITMTDRTEVKHTTHWQPAAPEAAADEHFEQRHQVQQGQRFH